MLQVGCLPVKRSVGDSEIPTEEGVGTMSTVNVSVAAVINTSATDPEVMSEPSTSVSPFTTTSAPLPRLFQDTAIYKWLNNYMEEYVDKSCEIGIIEQGFNKSEHKCNSLEEIILKEEVIWHFSTRSLYHSGILSGTVPTFDSNTVLSVDIEKEKGRTCKELLKKVQKHNRKTRNFGPAECMWKYQCKFNPHYFPSTILEATLVEDNHDDCKAIQLDDRYFRVPRRYPPHQDCWFPCHAARTILYEHDP